MPDVHDMLTLAQAADLVGIKHETLRRRAGTDFPAVKVGKTWLVSRADLEVFRQNRRKMGRPSKPKDMEEVAP